MHNRLLCASPALSSPGAQHWGHRAFALLDSVCFSLVPQAARLAPEAECAALLTFQQVGALRCTLYCNAGCTAPAHSCSNRVDHLCRADSLTACIAALTRPPAEK